MGRKTAHPKWISVHFEAQKYFRRQKITEPVIKLLNLANQFPILPSGCRIPDWRWPGGGPA